VKLRRATVDDLEACVEVQRAAAVIGYAHIFRQDEYPFPVDVVRSEWSARLVSDSHVVVADEGGTLVGTVGARPPWLESLFVLPERWGSGVAAALHDEALRLIAASGVTAATLDVMVDNARARRFYERRGWVPDGRTVTSPFPPYPTLLGYQRPLSS
jgi:GNAT superfamily N-acetyltransferase